MERKFNNGVWPVMLTPFTDDNEVDYEALEKLVNWYIENGVAGLFADCQSSEMFYLSLEERVKIASFVKEKAAGRVPVVASGHISHSLEDQAEELNAIARTGVDAVILITNLLAAEDEDDSIWLENLKKLLEKLPDDLALGFYECPYPYKRIISPELLKWCADTGRFYFIKDTSCSIDNMKKKLEQIKGSKLKLFNANSSTLLETLELGASGFSGVMANFHADLYVWLCRNYRNEPDRSVFREALRESRNPVCYNGDIFTAADMEEFSAQFPQVEDVMIGRGLAADPGLVTYLVSGKRPQKEEIRRFHDMILEGYSQILSGDRNILFRMKELWSYMASLFENSEKTGKKIKKAERLSTYKNAVDEMFRSCDLQHKK